MPAAHHNPSSLNDASFYRNSRNIGHRARLPVECVPLQARHCCFILLIALGLECVVAYSLLDVSCEYVSGRALATRAAECCVASRWAAQAMVQELGRWVKRPL